MKLFLDGITRLSDNFDVEAKGFRSGRIKPQCVLKAVSISVGLLLFYCSLAQASEHVVESGGMFSAYSGTSSNVIPAEGVIAAVAGPPVIYLGDLKQFEFFSQFSESGGVPLVDNQAFLTWWGIGHRFEIARQGNVDGETFFTRINRPDGGGTQSVWTWDESDGCWQLQNQSRLWCFSTGRTWVSGTSTIMVGDWNYELYYNDVLDPDSIKEFEVIGLTLEEAGPTSLSGRAGTTLSTPLQVKLIDYDGETGVAGDNVRFAVPSGSGFALVSNYTSPSSGSTATSLTVTTDSQGIAEAYVELSDTGATVNVTASASSAPINPPLHSANPVFSVTSQVTEVADIDDKKNQGAIDSNGCIGNPINLVTGNKFHNEEDVVGNSPAPLNFRRYYNLTESGVTSLGLGWRHSYDRSIVFNKVGKGRNATIFADVIRPDGKVLTLVDSGNGFVADADVYYTLIKKAGKWELRTDLDTLEFYDGKGKLLSITDSKGNVQQVSYDTQKRLSSVRTSSNEELVFNYDGNNFLVSIVYWASIPDPSAGQSRSWSYGYTNGILSGVTNPDGTQRFYHYENPFYPNALTGITDERGVRYATWEYDELGIAASSYHGVGVDRVDIFYDVAGQRIVTDSLGNETTYIATAQLGQGKVTDTTGPTCSTGDNSVAQYNYDPNTNDLLSQAIDGTTTQFGNYDVKGNPGFKIEAVGTPSERRTDFTYDSRFHSKIISIVEPSVYAGSTKVTTIVYDDAANMLSQSVAGFKLDGTSLSRTTTFEYSGPYQQLSQINGPRTDVADITVFDYYPDDQALYQHQGMLQRVTGPEGIVLRDNMQYNTNRQLVFESRPNGLILTYLWEPDTDRIASITETVGAISRVTSWTYLPTGDVATLTSPDGSMLTFSYDDARRLVSITDNLGNHIDYTLDSEGNVLNEAIYDSSDVLHRAIARSFDVYNRLDGLAQANEIVDFDFSSDGTLAREINGNSVHTDYSYDDLKRLVDTDRDATGVDANTANSLTNLAYDQQDNITAVTDPKTNQTAYGYDDLGNLTVLSSPDTGISAYNYDEVGNRTQTIDANAQIFTFTYDGLNRLVDRDAPGITHDLQYTYDNCANGVGKLCSIARGANKTLYTYNGFGEVVAKSEDIQAATGLVNASMAISYDIAGRVQAIDYPGNTGVVYGYDVLGNLNQLTLDRNGQTTELISNTTYEPFGPLSNVTLGNGLSRSIGYDEAYRITAINDPVYTATLTYDANGNIIDLTRSTGNLSTIYDALDKLTDAAGPVGTQSYKYDRNANRTMLTDNALTTSYAYESLSNRMSQINLDAVTLDANGNTTQLRGMTLTYSPDNRLTGISGVASYGYNGIGERVLKTDLSSETIYLYGPQGELIAQLDSAGHIDKAYIWMNGAPLAIVDDLAASNGTLRYIHNDHLGTPQALTDESGSVVWQATYKPFGLAAVNDDPDLDGSPIEFNLRFPGQYFDKETSLHYNYFRDYDPSTGRYIQSDPIGLLGGLNTYDYALQNPMFYIDSRGAIPVPVATAAVGAVVGAIAGGIQAANSGNNVLTGVARGLVVGGATGFFAGVGFGSGAAAVSTQLTGSGLGSSAGSVLGGLIGNTLTGLDIINQAQGDTLNQNNIPNPTIPIPIDTPESSDCD